jgi:hypothetical protein
MAPAGSMSSNRVTPPNGATSLATERHYTPTEVGEMWNISPKSVIRLFEDEPGVLILGTTERKFKRGKRVLRIPQTVLERVHRDWMQ